MSQPILFIKGGRQEDAKHRQIKNLSYLNVCLSAEMLQTHKMHKASVQLWDSCLMYGLFLPKNSDFERLRGILQ